MPPADLCDLPIRELGLPGSFSTHSCRKDEVAMDVAVVTAAEPPHLERLGVVVVVTFYILGAAYLARLRR